MTSPATLQIPVYDTRHITRFSRISTDLSIAILYAVIFTFVSRCKKLQFLILFL